MSTSTVCSKIINKETNSSMVNTKEKEYMSTNVSEDSFKYIMDMINMFYAHKRLYNMMREV